MGGLLQVSTSYCISLFVFIALVFAPVRAHDADYALTSVEWNDQVASLEVIHRLHTHHAFDAAALAAGGDHHQGDAARFAALGYYIEKHFAITDAEGLPLKLEFLGAEVQGDYVIAYQEASLNAPPASLFVRNDLLVDLQSDQINQVNITLLGAGSTLVFDKDQRGEFLQSAPANSKEPQD